MHSKAIVALAILGGASLLLVLVALSLRKDLPFHEVIPLDQGIAVINAEKWYMDKLQVTLTSPDGGPRKASFDNSGTCVFPGLSNHKRCVVEVSRTDLKGRLLYKKLVVEVDPIPGGSKYIVLVGASVGSTWDFPGLVRRANLGPGISLGYRTKYEYDKSDEIKSLTQVPGRVSGVIIKECAAYFPRDIETSMSQIKTWVKELKSHGITPVLATVVPVTKEHDQKHPGRLDSIITFNDAVKSFCSREKTPVLDLEKAVRVSESDRQLRNEYAKEDGLHLVRKAYEEAFDTVMLRLLKELEFPPTQQSAEKS